MSLSAGTALVYPLGAGGNLQLARGQSHLLFDRVGGQCRLAVLKAGVVVREEVFGLGSEARVLVEPLLPERPVVLQMEPVLALAPGGWLRGYGAIPLAWQVWIQGARGEPRKVERLEAEELKLAFVGPGGYVHPLECRLRPRRFLENDPARALLPLHLCCRGGSWREVRRLYLPLAGLELRRIGNLFVTQPVRVRFEASGPRLQVRSFIERPDLRAREAAS